MKIYQIVLYISDGCEMIENIVQHTFKNKDKAKEVLKTLEKELSEMSEDEISEKFGCDITYSSYWYDIEEYEIEDFVKEQSMANIMYEKEIDFILNTIRNDIKTQIFLNPRVKSENGLIEIELTHPDNYRVMKLKFKVETTLQSRGYSKKPFVDGDWSVAMGVYNVFEFEKISELTVRDCHFGNTFLYVVMPYIHNNMYF